MSKGPHGLYIKATAVSMRIQKIITSHDDSFTALSTEDFVFALLREENCEVVEALHRMGVTEATLKMEMAGKGKKKKRSA